jgi:uncharacterized protein (DUF924 family)
MTDRSSSRDVLDFWFEETDESKWFSNDLRFDALVVERFAALHERASRCLLFEWRGHPQGRLAEIIVLDQFSRNMFRGSPRSFAQDPLALVLAQEAVAAGADAELEPARRAFLYMPFMHSEALEIHDAGLPLFRSLGSENTLSFALRHRSIIERFGRYPHRNELLGRPSTDAEREFLQGPGSSF